MQNELHKVQVDFSGLMEVLGKNLYSSPLVAIRELVQNAHDSCHRRRIEHTDQFNARIDLITNAKEKTLTIKDSGAGLTHQEVIDYLATIGAGYTRKLRAQHENMAQDLIGAFGLGFLSAYVVSQRVEVLTTSYQNPHQTWKFSTRTGEQFTLSPHTQNLPVGTQVILSLQDDFESLCDATQIETILRRYCCLLPLPIHLNEHKTPINQTLAPWLQQSPDKQQSLAFAARFDRYYEPMTTVMIPPNADCNLQGGLIWIQEGGNYATSDNRSVWVFVRGMLVSQDARELVPQWAGFAGAIISCDGLTPTASREDIMKDATYTAVQNHVRDALIQGLEHINREDPVTWRRISRRHNEALLGSALCDERLFTLLASELTLPTSEGDLTASQILERDHKMHVTLYDHQGHEEVLFRALQKPIIDGMRYAAYPFAKHYCERYGIQLVQLGTQSGQNALFPEVDLPRTTKRGLTRLFEREGFVIKLTSYDPQGLNAVLVYDRQVELKQRIEDDEADKRISKAILGLARLHTATIDERKKAVLYLNLNAKLVKQTIQHMETDPIAAKQASVMIWNIALLMAPGLNAQKQLEAALSHMNTQLNDLIFGDT